MGDAAFEAELRKVEFYLTQSIDFRVFESQFSPQNGKIIVLIDNIKPEVDDFVEGLTL